MKLLLIALTALLASCKSPAPSTVRVMIGGGPSELEVDAGGSATIDGTYYTIRIEGAEEVANNIELGVRFLTGTHSFDESEGGLSLDLDTVDFGLVGVVRPFYDFNETFRIYAEGFAGYRHYFGESKISGLGISIRENNNDGGPIFGGGVGGEYLLGDGRRLLLGVEFSRHLTSDSGVDLDADDLAFLIGLSFSF